MVWVLYVCLFYLDYLVLRLLWYFPFTIPSTPYYSQHFISQSIPAKKKNACRVPNITLANSGFVLCITVSMAWLEALNKIWCAVLVAPFAQLRVMKFFENCSRHTIQRRKMKLFLVRRLGILILKNKWMYRAFTLELDWYKNIIIVFIHSQVQRDQIGSDGKIWKCFETHWHDRNEAMTILSSIK